MELDELQRHWDTFGRRDPLGAILTDPDRLGQRWDEAEFLKTGQEEIAAALDHARRLGVPRQRRRALDFGCGAGRLTQALASFVNEAVGVDIAPSMIARARALNRAGARCTFQANDRPDLSRFDSGSFDVIYTGRVLQHMAPRYAEAYLREFARVLAPGGYLSFDAPSEHGFFDVDGRPAQRPASEYRASIHIVNPPGRLVPGGRYCLILEIANTGAERWEAGAALNVGNHWIGPDGTMLARDDGRAAVPLPWPPGHRVRVELPVTAPSAPGAFTLQCDLVEEHVSWFADLGSSPGETQVIVGHGAAPPPAAPPPGEFEPVMEMHAFPRATVERVLAESGLTLLEVRPVHHCGPTWLAFRYDATTDRPERSR
jgi:SAM-dependent methyltransferase